MIDASVKPAGSTEILGDLMQTFLTTYARFIDADADAEQAANWATIDWNRQPMCATINLTAKKSIKSIG